MRTKVFFVSALLISSAALAEKTGVEDAAKQSLKGVTAPTEAVEGATAAGESLGQAKQLKGMAEDPSKASGEATKAVKNKAKEGAMDKAMDMMH